MPKSDKPRKKKYNSPVDPAKCLTCKGTGGKHRTRTDSKRWIPCSACGGKGFKN